MKNWKAIILAVPSLLLIPLDFGIGCDPEGCGFIFSTILTGYFSIPCLGFEAADFLMQLGRLFGLW